MNEHDFPSLEPPDHPCEQCGLPKPRLLFDHESRLLLCETCLEQLQRRLAWTLLREAETA